jgi:amino acid adenylation domain-containing protein
MKRNLSTLLIESRQRRPDATACSLGELALSFEQLHDRAGRVAQLLRTAGAEPGRPILIWSSKRLEYVVAIHGILYSGCCYVPLDGSCTQARATAIARQTGPRIIIGQYGLVKTLCLAEPAPGEAGDDDFVICVLDDSTQFPARAALLPWSILNGIEASAGPVDSRLAYVLFTSGSSGTPKGVVHTHESALAFVDWSVRAVGLTDSDIVSQYSNYSFDLSIFDLFSSLSAGARMIVVPERMFGMPGSIARLIGREKVTIWYSVPSALFQYGEAGINRLADTPLRCIILAGEQVEKAPLRQLFDLVGSRCRILNWYGPTETNVCTHHEVTSADFEAPVPVPIGRACPYAEITVARDADHASAEAGELWVAGPSVMQGYWDASELTPKAVNRSAAAGSFYKTGDLAELYRGEYVLRGRLDRQLKVRGYRVQPEEIEATVNQVDGVRESAVVRCRLNGRDGLAALFSGTGDLEELTVQISDRCNAILPFYMVPDICLPVASMFKNARGKTDYSRVSQWVESVLRFSDAAEPE